MKTSNLFTLNWKDAGKGLLVAVVSAVLTTVQTSLANNDLTFDWKLIAQVAGTTAVAYLVKNFFTPSQIVTKD